MEVTCFYHGNQCLDGFTSAWLVKKAYPQAKLIPVDYHDKIPYYPKGKVLVVDFTFPDQAVMERLIETADQVIHFDHHDTAVELAKTLAEKYPDSQRYQQVFDLKRSGAAITYDQLIERKAQRELFPVRWRIVDMVQDQDLWKWELAPESVYLTTALKDSIATITSEQELLAEWDHAAKPMGEYEFLKHGKVLHQEKLDRCRKRINETLQWLVIELSHGVTQSVPFTLCSQRSDISEQGNMMLSDALSTLVGVVQPMEGGKLKVRLNAAKNGPHAGKIAKHHGGGGHPKSAGFVVDWTKSPFCELELDAHTLRRMGQHSDLANNLALEQAIGKELLRAKRALYG